MRFAKRSSTRGQASRASLLVAAAVLAAATAALAATGGWSLLSGLRVGTAVGAATALGVYLILSERRRHEQAAGELVAQASFLESLVESIRKIAAMRDARDVLEQTRREAERLFKARARLVHSGDEAPAGRSGGLTVPLSVPDQEVTALQLERDRPFERGDDVRAHVLADFAERAQENARLLAEAQVRQAERAQLSDQLITAEQDERRRLALYLHDTVVQSLSGIALMLDAGMHSIETENLAEAKTVIGGALDRHRDAIKALRDLSFNLEPVVLRDQGFGPAVLALAEQIGVTREIRIDVDVEPAESLPEKAQAALYQIIREALHQAIRRGPPTRMSIAVERTGDGGLVTAITDDAPGERRRRTFEPIEERARTLAGRLEVDQLDVGGTTVRIVLPPYATE
ncbi:MAG: hypothetical protein QOE36_3073 [Gaiellaceae bacterium]|nr:hypothetical protein [Gaiellaceae bacterium]